MGQKAFQRKRSEEQGNRSHAGYTKSYQPSTTRASRYRGSTNTLDSTIMQMQQTMGNKAVAQLLASSMRSVSKQPIQRQEAIAEEDDMQLKATATIQRQGELDILEEDDNEDIQLKRSSPIQRVEELEEDENNEIQLKRTGGSTNPTVQLKENRSGLPHALQAGVESLSGMDLSNVKVHYNSSKPTQLQALAYAQGNDIHVGPGQEKHLPHEAWHVVQQRQGRVKPTLQMAAGVAINDDKGLEREADVMGQKALQQTAQRSAPST